MRSDERDQIDSILEQALSNYSNQEPRPGLEDRVVQHVFSAGARPWFVFPVWAFAAAAAALLLILAPIAWIYHHPTPATSQPAARAELKKPAPNPLSVDLATPPIARRERKRSRDREGADNRSDRALHGGVQENVTKFPKQQEFPAPSPLTDEERALLALAARAPDEALSTSIDQAQPDIAPIEVKEIDIEPVRIDGLQQGEE
jgi:hypothetical protein